MNRISPTLSSLGNTEVALADLMDEVARSLQAGQPIDVEALTSFRPELAEPLRLLLPAIQVLVGLGESALSSDGALSVEPDSRTSCLGVLGDFRIVREIGRGGMGVVYEAEQISLGRRVALKVLPFAATLDPRHIQRFKIEAQAAGCLHHNNIVPVHAVGQERGVHYYAMQLIEGRPLTALICELSSNRQASGEFRKHESTSPKNIKPSNDGVTVPVAALTTELVPGSSTYYTAIAELGIQAAEALEYAHQQGVIHRDIKPGNLLIDDRGRLWVTDFGLAHVQANASLTMSGGLIGTLRYMSPEQALAGHVVIDHRTDVYSLGMTLYELLTLEPAFDGRNREQLLNQIALAEPRLLRQLDRRIPVELETIVLKAIAKEPEARYASAADFADDLRRFRDHQPIRACPPSLVDRIHKWGRRHRQLVGAAWIFLTFAVVGLSVSTYLIASKHNEVVRERDRARQTAEDIRGHLYVAHMAQAFRAWQAHDHEGMLSFLERQRPGPEQTDLRGIEWGLLHRLARLTPHPERTLRGQKGEVYCVAFAPDGSAVASAGMDGKVHFWNPATGEKGPRSLEHRTEVNWVAYSPSGKLLATACDDGLVVVWDVATGRFVRKFTAHEGKTVNCVAFSADETLLASSTQNREVKYWSVGSYRQVTTLPRDATGQFVAFAPDGNSWCTANGDVITLWDWKSKALRHVFRVVGKAILNVQYSHDSRILAAAVEDGVIRRWETTTGRSLPDLVHGSAVQSLAFSPDDRTLASAGDSATIRIWDLTANAELPALSGHRSRVWCLAYSPDGNLLTSCGHDQSIQFWQPGRFREKIPLSLPAANPRYAAFSPDCQSLITQNKNGDVDLWDVNTGQLTSKLPFPLGEIGAIASSPIEPLLALCRVDETIQLWNLNTNKPCGFLEGSAPSIIGASFSPDGKRLAVAFSKGIAVWNVATGRREKLFLTAWPAVRPTFSPDSKLVAGVCDQGTVGLWNVETGAKVGNLRSQPFDGIGSLAFSPHGALLAVGFGATIKLWDVESGVERTTLVSNEGTAGLQVAFSPDGKTLASQGGKEGRIILWSVATGQEILTLDWGTWPMWALLFSPDGQALVAAGGWPKDPEHPSKLLIWRADPN